MTNVNTQVFRQSSAARELLYGAPVFQHKSRRQSEINIASDYLLENHTKMVDGFIVPDEHFERLAQPKQVKAAHQYANVDPFTMDAVDMINLLANEDPDRANDLNERGFSKATSYEGHRLVNQYFNIGKLTILDLQKIDDFLSPLKDGSHYDQIVQLVSELSGISAGEVNLVLMNRFETNEVFESLRINLAIDDNFDFTQHTYAWFDAEKRAIGVHASNAEIETFSGLWQWFKSLPEYTDLFKELQVKFSKDAVRTVNGEKQKFSTLWFPEELADPLHAYMRDRPFTVLCHTFGTLVNNLDPDNEPEPTPPSPVH